jgi:hypothetical protein
MIDKDAVLDFLEQTKTLRRCTRKSGRERGRRGTTELPDLTRIWSSSSLQWWKTATEFFNLAARFERRKGERREEGVGYLRPGS